MINNKPYLHLNITRIIFFLCAFVLMASNSTFAQAPSQRRSGTRAQATQFSTPAQAALARIEPQKDIDLFVGKIIRKDGEFVIVYVMSPSRVSNRVPLYYACDIKMRPTAILENMKISHRACTTFKVVEGDAMVGDTVMVKYLAPKIEDEIQKDEEKNDNDIAQ